MDENNIPNATISESADSSEEKRKALARKRIFWVVVALDIIVAVLIFYEILSLFL